MLFETNTSTRTDTPTAHLISCDEMTARSVRRTRRANKVTHRNRVARA